MGTVGVAERVRCGSSNDRDVNMYFPILDCLPASAVRPKYTHAAHFALRAVVTQWSIHAAFDMMDHARLHQVNRVLLRRK